MANAVTSVLSFAMMIAVIFAVLNGVLKLTSDAAETQAAVSRDAAQSSLGSLSMISATATPDGGATNVDITIFNEGSLSYSQWSDWDVNISYTNLSGTIKLESDPYRQNLVDGTWSLQGVYMDAGQATTELLEPSVFNPNEYLVIRMRLDEGTKSGSDGWIVVTPEDGVSASVFFDA